MTARGERRLLEFVYTTDAPVTPGSVAYALGGSVDQASRELDEMVAKGALKLEVTDDGELRYTAPGRAELARASQELPAVANQKPPGVPVMQVGGAAAPVAPVAELPATHQAGTRPCPFCGEEILAVARKCKHCSELLDPALRTAQAVQVNVGVQNVAPSRPQGQASPGVAAVLAFLWPGAGHLYCGHIFGGLALMVFTFLGYAMLILPGFLLHVASIFSAATLARRGG